MEMENQRIRDFYHASLFRKHLGMQNLDLDMGQL